MGMQIMLNDAMSLQENFIKSQLRPNKVKSLQVLDAFLNTPRDLFLPSTLSSQSYLEKNIRLDHDRYLLSPLALAQLLERANLKAEDKGLVIGFATGYSLALLSQIISITYGIESNELLMDQAQESLSQFGIPDLPLTCQFLPLGCDDFAPYDFILIEGSVHKIPQSILCQLSVGGRLATLIKKEKHCATGVIITRTATDFETSYIFEMDVPYLPGFEPATCFQF